MKQRAVLVIVLLALLAAISWVAAPPVAAESPSYILVKVNTDKRARFAQFAHETGLVDEPSPLNKIGWRKVRVPSGEEQKWADQLCSIGMAASVPKVYEALDIPNDEYWPELWGMRKIGMPEAWDDHTTGYPICIADTGIDSNHPDLAPNIVAMADLTGGDNPEDDYGHGTHVAGTAAAIGNNGIGVAGINWNAPIYSAKVLRDGWGWTDWVIAGGIWCADQGASVVNMSLGGPFDPIWQDLADYIWEHGGVLVASAGNSNSAHSPDPACHAHIAVAATDENDQFAGFSNYGGWVEIAAPGVKIFSTFWGGYRSWQGTSMASPHVAGAVSFLMAVAPREAVLEALAETALPLTGQSKHVAWGRLDVAAALSYLREKYPLPPEKKKTRVDLYGYVYPMPTDPYFDPITKETLPPVVTAGTAHLFIDGIEIDEAGVADLDNGLYHFTLWASPAGQSGDFHLSELGKLWVQVRWKGSDIPPARTFGAASRTKRGDYKFANLFWEGYPTPPVEGSLRPDPHSGFEGVSAGNETQTYVVVWGDTLSHIARRFSTTVSVIGQANAEQYPTLTSNPDYIQVGWVLQIPGT